MHKVKIKGRSESEMDSNSESDSSGDNLDGKIEDLSQKIRNATIWIGENETRLKNEFNTTFQRNFQVSIEKLKADLQEKIQQLEELKKSKSNK
jgi:hypothetical protein